jgi:hypothetical protein
MTQLLKPESVRAFAPSAVSWNDIERITGGRFGRTMAVCPLCSEQRRTIQKRRSKVLAINRTEPDFAVYFCNHCEAQGYVRPDTPGHVVDLVERQRRRGEGDRKLQADKATRSRAALQLFKEAQPYRGSPIEDYLYHTRKISDWLDSFAFLDQVFRFHPRCVFGEERLPCMLALVRDIKTDAPVAIHRTALNLAGKYPERIDRMSLGPTSGGAIKISPNCEVHSGLLIGEGVETVLSASKKLQFKPVWSLVSKNNLRDFPVLSGIECVTVIVDNDAAGKEAAAECTRRLVQAGVEVITAQTNLKKDFNDVLHA